MTKLHITTGISDSGKTLTSKFELTGDGIRRKFTSGYHDVAEVKRREVDSAELAVGMVGLIVVLQRRLDPSET